MCTGYARSLPASFSCNPGFAEERAYFDFEIKTIFGGGHFLSGEVEVLFGGLFGDGVMPEAGAGVGSAVSVFAGFAGVKNVEA
jgi:hypothetical protein